MTQNINEAVIRSAYGQYAEGDLARMLEFVDPDLEWTYLDPAVEDPQPQTCHGRHELETSLQGLLDSGLRSHLEEVRGQGDRIMVVVRTPGSTDTGLTRPTTVITTSLRCGLVRSSPSEPVTIERKHLR
jgi:ketosteroid isomerase-like protein